MPDQPPTLDYQPATPNRSTGSLRALLAFIALLAAVLYHLAFHLSPDAPMRSPGVRAPSLDRAQRLLAGTDAAFASAARGQNLQLHFAPPARAFDKFMGTIYFHANYTLYPKRLLVGTDDRIVNNADDLLDADAIPPTQWMKQHDIAAIATLLAPVDQNRPPEVQVQSLR